MGGRGSAGLGLGSCSLGSMVQDWAACVWRSWCCGAEDCEPAGVFRGVCVASCPSCVPGRIRPRWREVQGGLGAVDVTAAMSTCQEGGQRCPGKNLLPGMRGCWCRSTHRGGGGSRGGDALWGLRRRLLPPPRPPPPRAERQQCQQWLQPKPGPLEVAGEQGRCWFYGLSRDVFMAGMGLPWMLPSPALGDMAGACSASWC